MLQYYTIYDILYNPLCIGVTQELCSKLNSMKGPLIETSESAHILFLFFWNFCHERGNPYIALEFYLALQIPVLIPVSFSLYIDWLIKEFDFQL